MYQGGRCGAGPTRCVQKEYEGAGADQRKYRKGSDGEKDQAKGFGQRKQKGREKDDNETKTERLIRERRKKTRTRIKEKRERRNENEGKRPDQALKNRP